jgi:HEPN domain-containing protein
MKDNAALARGWMRKGDSDLADARRTVGSDGPYDTACFHAQQAMEKYLKALLAWHGQPIVRTHDLEELQRLCVPLLPLSEFATLDLTELSGYAVELRYDADFWPERDTASEAVALAEKVRALIVRFLPGEAEH